MLSVADAPDGNMRLLKSTLHKLHECCNSLVEPWPESRYGKGPEFLREDRNLKLIEDRIAVRVNKREASAPIRGVWEQLIEQRGIGEASLDATLLVLKNDADHSIRS
jgi:hypothetical protein